MKAEEVVALDIDDTLKELLEGEDEGSTFIGTALSDDGIPMIAVGIVHNGEVVHSVHETDEESLRDLVKNLGYTLEKLQ